MIKQILSCLSAFLLLTLVSCKKENSLPLQPKIKSIEIGPLQASVPSNQTTTIPLYGNATISKPPGASEILTSYNGLANWTNAQTVTSLSVNAPYTGTLKLALNLKVAPSGQSSVIKVTVDGISKDVSISGDNFHDVVIGEYIISSPKSVQIDFKGVSKTGGYFADLLSVKLSGTAINGQGTIFTLPLAGNAFITTTGGLITGNGLANWTNPTTVGSTYFHAKNSGNLSLTINAKVPSGNTVARITINGLSKDVSLTGSGYTDFYVGDFPALLGYNKIDIQGISKTGTYYGDVANYKIGSDAVSSGVLYSNDPDYYYWARRGPSCRLGYTIPTSSSISYYYSEIQVPTGEDKIGSYFMANGFSQGYFGIQVNSSTERRVLFSVWSPYNTDNPNDIPDDQKIILNRKGSDVVTGEFGNEGSGGQSFLRYNWVAENTYKFLLKGEPDGTGKTDFTAWFYVPESGSWKLIASFKRPNTNTYLTGFHSFLENFNKDNGHMGRSANYKNQWVRTTTGTWMVVSGARFTVDGTYSANQRIDATGGTNSTGFYLKNGGFFNNGLAPNTQLSFTNTSSAPSINFNNLP